MQFTGITLTGGVLVTPPPPPPPEEMILKINANIDSGYGTRTIRLPVWGTNTNVSIDWGDGTSNTRVGNFSKGQFIEHVYPANTVYTLTIAGNMSGFGAGIESFSQRFQKQTIELVSWGNTGLLDVSGAFLFSENLVSIPNGPLPNRIANMAFTFDNCRRLNSNNFPNAFPEWDVSNVTNFFACFRANELFNPNIANWNTSNVTTMQNMFNEASTFNQPIGNWNVSNVTNMEETFRAASRFNQPIGNWNVSKVTNMTNMFLQANAFNQNIGNWNTSNVTTMSGAFSQANAFNQNIGNWNVSKVTNMTNMFNSAINFNQNLSSWFTNVASQPTGFSTGANAVFANNASNLKPYLQGGIVRINT